MKRDYQKPEIEEVILITEEKITDGIADGGMTDISNPFN